MSHPRLTTHFIPIWKEAPALRLLLPLMAGITIQWYLPIPFFVLLVTAITCFGLLFYFYRSKKRNRLYFSIVMQLLLTATGALLIWLNDARHQPSFIGKHYTDSAIVLATLQEPLVEKANSYKAEASIRMLHNGHLQTAAGKIILYFKKDNKTGKPLLQYGSQIVFSRPLQAIRNAGNPGGFDYERYSAFHNLFYQVFLSQRDYIVQPQREINPFRQHLFAAQQWVLRMFQQYIPGRLESGMAEALLIGYRNDLDRDLVQRYSNTGVVHIIAISGMHLGLIYWLVLLPFALFKKTKKRLVLQAISAIAVLWFFSLLTGASPSILRSAVMFTFIALGNINRRTNSIYNNLALSALLILLFDPFSLWDVGFQLSYAAVLSIVVFAKWIAAGLYVPNKYLRTGWKLTAVTLAAQILTYPLVVYHFHQFPTLFLLTNLVAVPLSTGLIYALLALLLCSPFPPVAKAIGLLIQTAIEWLNHFISWVNDISFALIDQISVSIPQVVFLFLTIAAAGWWLQRRSSNGLVAALFSLTGFMLLYTGRHMVQTRQHKLIVYNVPQHAAIDIVAGKQCLFVGDDELLEDGFLQNFHLKPSRVLHQTTLTHALPNVRITPAALQLGGTKLLVIHSRINPVDTVAWQPDVLILSGNPAVKLEMINRIFHPKIIVADATNKYYRVERWQQEAVHLHLRFHPVAAQGAYVQEW